MLDIPSILHPDIPRRSHFRTQRVRNLSCEPIKSSGFPKESCFVGIKCTENADRGLFRRGVKSSHPRRGLAEGGQEPPGVVEVGEEAGGKGRNGCGGMISQSYL